MSGGQVFGVIVGVLALVAVVVALGWYGMKKCKKGNDGSRFGYEQAPILSRGGESVGMTSSGYVHWSG